MEQLFMQAFERGDWLAAQVRQQADSYSQTLACGLLAAGHKPPEWLIPSTTLPQELNGKPIVLTGRQITTPSIDRSVFLPLAGLSTLSTKSGVPNGYTWLDTNCTAVGTDQHEEQQQEQTSLGQELPDSCTADKIFSRIKRSRSRQRHIEDHLHGGGQAAKSGSSDDMPRSNVGIVGSNRSAAASLFIPCDDVENRAETTSRTSQRSIQGGSVDLLKCVNNVENQGAQSNKFPSLILENINICSDSNIGASNNYSVRDSPSLPLPVLSKTNIADSVCHQIPDTHLLVEPKKLQFDGIEPVCINPSSEQTSQQQETGLISGHLDLAGRNSSSEDPSSTSSHRPHSMGRLLLDHVGSGHLNPDSAPVEQHHTYALESGHSDYTGMHSSNKKPFLMCSAEVPNSMGEPLLHKDADHIPETNSLGTACIKVSQPLETYTSNSDKANCAVVKSYLENDALQAIEDTEKPQDSKSPASPPVSVLLQLPTQLPDATFGAHASGISSNCLLGEDGCDHLPNLQKNDSNSRCSQGRSSVSPELIPSQNIISTDFCQPSLLSYKTQGNGKHFDGCAAVDAFKSADKELSQEQHLLVRPPLELNGSIDVETPLGQPLLGMQNEMLQANPVSDSIDCTSGKLGDKSDSMVPKGMSISSSRRTREMRRTERNNVASSEKCNEKLQQGKEETSHAEDDTQINANSCTTENIEKRKFSCTAISDEKKNKDQEDREHAQKRSVADGVQINGGMSSKRKRTKCRDIVLPCSQGTSPFSPNQDSNGTHVVTVEKLSGKSQPSARYFLRSSGFSDFSSLKSATENDAMNRHMSVASDVQQNGKSFPKLRNRSNPSEIALCNSSSANALSPSGISNMNVVEGMENPNNEAQLQIISDVTITSPLPRSSNIAVTICNSSSANPLSPCGISSRNVTEEMDLQNYEAELQNIADVATTALRNSSNIAVDNMELCMQQENPYFQHEDPSFTNSRVEHQQITLQTDEILSQGVILNPENYCSTDSTNIFPSYALDQHDKHASAPIALFHDKLSYSSDIEVDRRFRSEDLTGRLLSDAAIPMQKDDESVDCNDKMPQFESFDFSVVPFDSPTTEERTFGTLHDSNQFATFSFEASKNYKMGTVSGMRQLLATMSGKAADCLFSDDETQRESIDGRITDIFGSSGLGHNGLLFTSDAVASCSSNASSKQENSEKQLTPVVDKYYLGKHSEKIGSFSDHMGSIPELSCFRIDEDSDIADENQYQDILPGSVGNQGQSGRTLQDITGLCQNTGNSASYLIGIMDTGETNLTTETCSSKLDRHPDIRNDGGNKKRKESCASLVKKGGKMSHSLHNRLSKTEARYVSEGNPGKRSKTSNIVTNVASFIPLVKPKVQSTEACVKKDVRVKALEAAEAAKRLEEKKRNEREMRKAAAKLEREKLKQERDLKQKQDDEEKKKRNADVATRKRQRDEEERREKERKRKCVEAARKQQKQPMERRHANNEKDAHPKASDTKELQKNAEMVKDQVHPDEMSGIGDKATIFNNEKAVIADESTANFRSQSQESVPNNIEESYIMTPYKDSDDEDDDFEHKEELRRRRKLIPSWVRGENLEKVLLYNYALDPRKIFAQKCFAELSEICPVHIPQRSFR